MRLNLDVFRENSWSGEVNGNQRGTPPSSSDPVTISLREKTGPLGREFHGKEPRQGQASIKTRR